MVYGCCGCDWTKKDRRAAASLDELTVDALHGKVPTHCADCGSVVAPEHLKGTDLEGWVRLFSRCTNAMNCIEENAYRTECEQLVFSPRCLTFLWKSAHETNLLLSHVFRITDGDLYRDPPK